MNISNIIRDLDLGINEQHRGDCPVCAGHKTFTVTRTVNGVLFNCYKAGCKLAGRRSSAIRVSDVQRLNTTVDSTPFRLPSHVFLGRPEITEWINKHNYPFDNLELYYDIHENRIVFPVRYKGRLVDATGRSRDIGIRRLPKWKRYGTASYAYTAGNGTVAIIVEDAISAAVLGATDAGYTGVALMGTSLLPAHLEQLQGYTGVIVALDPDAYKKTLLYTQELRGQFPKNKVLAAKIADDLKYRGEHDMVLIKELSTFF